LLLAHIDNSEYICFPLSFARALCELTDSTFPAVHQHRYESAVQSRAMMLDGVVLDRSVDLVAASWEVGFGLRVNLAVIADWAKSKRGSKVLYQRLLGKSVFID